MFLRAVRGGEPSHRASASASTDTSEFALHSRAASTICCLRGPASTEPPGASTRMGPRILKRGSGRCPFCRISAMLGDFDAAAVALDLGIRDGVQPFLHGIENRHLVLGELSEHV